MLALLSRRGRCDSLPIVFAHVRYWFASKGAATDVIPQVVVRDHTKDLALPCFLKESSIAVHVGQLRQLRAPPGRSVAVLPCCAWSTVGAERLARRGDTHSLMFVLRVTVPPFRDEAQIVPGHLCFISDTHHHTRQLIEHDVLSAVSSRLAAFCGIGVQCSARLE